MKDEFGNQLDAEGKAIDNPSYTMPILQRQALRRAKRKAEQDSFNIPVRLTLNGEFVCMMFRARPYTVYEQLDVVVTQKNMFFSDENDVIGFAAPKGELLVAMRNGKGECEAMALCNTDLRALINLGAFDEKQEAYIYKQKKWSPA